MFENGLVRVNSKGWKQRKCHARHKVLRRLFWLKKKSTSFESLPYPFSVLLKKTMNLFWLLYLFQSVHFDMLENSWIGREQ